MAVLIPSPDVSSVPGCYRKISTKILSSSKPRMVQNFKVSKVARGGIRVLISSKIKDLEPKVSDLAENVGNYGNFSANTAEVKQSKEDEERQNYYVNTGDAIRTIREEFPDLFYRELSFDIYRDDIVFKDPLNTFFGIENYKSIFSALRFHGKIFFKALWVDIISVWQPVESTIMVRWTVHGIPRVPWESRGRFDGTSEYKLDKHGKIYEHKVYNIALNAPPRFHVLSVNAIIQSLGCPSTPKPTFFENSSHPPSESSNLSAKLNMMNEYLASVLTHNAEPSQQQ